MPTKSRGKTRATNKTSKRPVLQPRAFTIVSRISSQFHEQDAIRIILDVSGHYDVPATLEEIKKKQLMDNLGYTDKLLEVLVVELDKYVKTIRTAASISDGDIADAETVGDIIDIVADKVK